MLHTSVPSKIGAVGILSHSTVTSVGKSDIQTGFVVSVTLIVTVAWSQTFGTVVLQILYVNV